MVALTEAQRELFGLKDFDENYFEKGVLGLDQFLAQSKAVSGRLKHEKDEKVLALLDRDFATNNVTVILAPFAMGKKLLEGSQIDIKPVELEDFVRQNKILTGKELFFDISGIDKRIEALACGQAWAVSSMANRQTRGYFSVSGAVDFFVINFYDFQALGNKRAAAVPEVKQRHTHHS